MCEVWKLMLILVVFSFLQGPGSSTVASAFLLSPEDAALSQQPQPPPSPQQQQQQQQQSLLQGSGLLLRPIQTTTSNSNSNGKSTHHGIHRQAEQQRQEWTDKSIAYYSTIMRAERRRNMGQINEAEWDSAHYQETLLGLAQKHYFALRKIKSGQYRHAELIYRRIIQELLTHKHDDNEHVNGNGNDSDADCDHASLAVTTLLLALHLQRMGDLKQTRSVFLHFFRVVVLQSKSNTNNNTNNNSNIAKEECSCSAKVLGAYALFEMKRGNRLKSLEIAKKAIEFDPTMEPVLQWKQFREVVQRQRVVSGGSINHHE